MEVFNDKESDDGRIAMGEEYSTEEHKADGTEEEPTGAVVPINSL